MTTFKPVIFPLVAQHAKEAGFLWTQRAAAVNAPNLSLRHLARHDERLASHLDGIRVANGAGETACSMQLAAGNAGSMFVATSLLIEGADPARLEPMLALSAAAPDMRPGLFAALGWSESSHLRGNVVGLLSSPIPLRRLAGTVACSMHRVDPGLISAARIEDPDPKVRARALRTAGELGRRELVSRFSGLIGDDDPTCQLWAAWSAVLLGDRNKAHDVLLSFGSSEGPERERAFRLALMSMRSDAAHGVLQQLAQDPAGLRCLIKGSGFVGDPRYVSWLISRMTDDSAARLAGEAFSLITGADLTALNLGRKRPGIVEAGPNDDPNDPNVDMDEDDGLPWPDPVKIQAWWHANSSRFQPGMRYFMGEPLNRENCLRVLKEGYQRQRIAAALYLSLLNPGTPLFEWRAPAWRQQRLLAEMI